MDIEKDYEIACEIIDILADAFENAGVFLVVFNRKTGVMSRFLSNVDMSVAAEIMKKFIALKEAGSFENNEVH